MPRVQDPIVDVAAELDAAPLVGFHWLIVALCGLVYALDGFDTQVIAFVAPAVAAAWHLPVTGFGPVFAAGLVGLMLGALAMGPLADRYGRRRLVLAATLLFGVFSLATPLAGDTRSLMALRFLTGLGLGGAMPNIIALTAEYMPARRRTMLVTLMSCGFASGGFLGGIAATALIPRFGWQAMFVLGGVLPLLLLPVLAALLPESIRYAVKRGGDPRRLAQWLSRATGRSFAADRRFVLPGEAPIAAPVAALFTNGRAAQTLLLWPLFFMNLFVNFSLINWLPAVIHASGAPMTLALTATILLNLGVLFGVAPAWVADRFGAPLIAGIACLIAAGCLLAIGYGGLHTAGLLAMCFLLGTFNLGTTFIALAIAASFYPTAMRSTGIGWAFGVGRFGSILGPLAAGAMLTAQWPLSGVFLLMAIADVCGAVAAFGLVLLAPRGAAEPGATTAEGEVA